jgi:GNAT superfamily N-acetyltransferase
MYKLMKIGKLDFPKLNAVAHILNACGKDMANKYDLHHWDNPFIKTLIIVGLCDLKNEIYILYDGNKPVATFMTKRNQDELHFEKLGTLPSESGKGIGSYCMSKIEEMAKDVSCKKVVMEVYEPSHHAISFYEHKGYTVVGMTDTLKYKEVKMEKRI